MEAGRIVEVYDLFNSAYILEHYKWRQEQTKFYHYYEWNKLVSCCYHKLMSFTVRNVTHVMRDFMASRLTFTLYTLHQFTPQCSWQYFRAESFPLFLLCFPPKLYTTMSSLCTRDSVLLKWNVTDQSISLKWNIWLINQFHCSVNLKRSVSELFDWLICRFVTYYTFVSVIQYSSVDYRHLYTASTTGLLSGIND